MKQEEMGMKRKTGRKNTKNLKKLDYTEINRKKQEETVRNCTKQ